MELNVEKLRQAFEKELTGNILNYWITEGYDPGRRLFYGRISRDEKKFTDAPLCAVFTTRIMWAFSAAYRFFPKTIYREMAGEAFRILMEMFWDPVHKGIYWSILPDGQVLDDKKQFYAEAFFLYALSEYVLAFGDEKAKETAVVMFNLLEKHAFDQEYGGYFEAKTADWQETDDQRLSPKELNVKKSMNTHLHILEASTNFCRIHPTAESMNQLYHLIRIFLDKIIDPQTFHFHLFFDADWKVRSAIDSYGHDIEGSWLLCEAAGVLGDQPVLEEVEQVALKMVFVTAMEGLGREGGLYYEKEGMHLQEQYDWWPQAEAVVGFFHAWQLSGDEKYLYLAAQSWEFINKYLIDKKRGEWFWGVSAQLMPLPNDKVNGWKAPYHNGRMCMEMMRRLESAG